MELRPKYEAPPWAPTNKGHGITSWPISHHHATIVELRPNQTKIMFLQPTQSHYTYQSHVNIYNQSSHSCYMPRSCHTHQFQPINHPIHAKSLIPCFNIVNQTKHVANIQEPRRKQNLGTFSLRLKGLAQMRGFSRSGELLSPRQELEKWNNGVLAFYRWGETSSPERDGFSPKTPGRVFWYSRLGETHSLGRDYQISSTVHAGQHKNSLRIMHKTCSYHFRHHTITKSTKQNWNRAIYINNAKP